MKAQERILNKYGTKTGTLFHNDDYIGNTNPMSTGQSSNPFGQENSNTNQYTSPTQNGSQQQFFQQASVQNQPEDPYLAERLAMYNSPDFVKFTTDCFPKTNASYNNLGFPLVSCITPFAQPYEIPNTVDMDPIRCSNCRCFINPYWEFKAGGEMVKCNLCFTTQKISDKHYAHQGDNGLPVNYEERPELYSGTYEFKVGEEFSIRPPVDPTYLFIIDVTVSSLDTGIPHMVFASLRKIIEDKQLNGEEKARFGILCFDSRIHLVTLCPTSKKPKISTMVGNFDQCPLPLSSIQMQIEDFSDPSIWELLETIPDSFHRMGDISKAIPVRSLIQITNMQLRPCGGKTIMVQANDVQDWGDVQKIPQNMSSRNMFLPTNGQFANQGVNLSLSQICFDFFVFGRQKTRNLITLFNLCKYICCDICYYTDIKDENLEKFNSEFWFLATRKLAWETGIRVRTSPGWEKKTYGNYHYKTTDQMSPSAVDDSYSFMVEVYPKQGATISGNTFGLQVSFLYTNEKRERMLRVINHSSKLGANTGDCYAGIDATTLTEVLFKKHLSRIYEQVPLADVNKGFLDQAKKIYNSYYQQAHKRIQEDGVDALERFPFQMLGALKHPVYCLASFNSYNAAVDARNVLRINLEKYNSHEIGLQINPWLFRLDTLEDDQCEYDESGYFVYPDLLGLSYDSLVNEGVFMLNDGFDIYLWVGPQTDPSVLDSLFNIESFEDINQHQLEETMFTKGDALANKVYNLIADMRSKKTTKYQSLFVVPGGKNTSHEQTFYYRQYEEKNDTYVGGYRISYYDFYNSFISNQFSPGVNNFQNIRK